MLNNIDVMFLDILWSNFSRYLVYFGDPFVTIIKVLQQLADQLRANFTLCRGGRQLVSDGSKCNDTGPYVKKFHVQNCSSGNETEIQHKHTYFLQINKGGKFLEKLWCCIGGRV